MVVEPLSFFRTSFFTPRLEYLTSNQVLCWLNIAGLKFYNISLKGGMGVFSRKILKTKKAGEAISGHFAVAILP